jgi:hypothetical protein
MPMGEFVRHLALIALLLRALVPAGWMPGTTAAAPLVICSVNAPAQHAPGEPARHDSDRHDICPFAAAPHFAETPQHPLLAAPALHVFEAAQRPVLQTPARVAGYRPHAPRAPPISA